MTYSLETKIGELLNDNVAVEILEKHAPGISTNPMLGFVKGMTLDQLLAFPQAKQYGITEEMVLKVLADIEIHKNT
jgi:hypothetical protein